MKGLHWQKVNLEVQTVCFQKKTIARRAAEIGVTNAIRYFKKKFTDRELKESTVRLWVNRYKKELTSRRKLGREDMTVTKLESKKRGRPLLLGEELDKQVQMYIKNLGSKGCPINTAIIMATAMGIVKIMIAICFVATVCTSILTL